MIYYSCKRSITETSDNYKSPFNNIKGQDDAKTVTDQKLSNWTCPLVSLQPVKLRDVLCVLNVSDALFWLSQNKRPQGLSMIKACLGKKVSQHFDCWVSTEELQNWMIKLEYWLGVMPLWRLLCLSLRHKHKNHFLWKRSTCVLRALCYLQFLEARRKKSQLQCCSDFERHCSCKPNP